MELALLGDCATGPVRRRGAGGRVDEEPVLRVRDRCASDAEAADSEPVRRRLVGIGCYSPAGSLPIVKGPAGTAHHSSALTSARGITGRTMCDGRSASR